MKKGMTALEILVVLAVICILAWIAIPEYRVYRACRKTPSMSSCIEDMRSRGKKIKLYRPAPNKIGKQASIVRAAHDSLSGVFLFIAVLSAQRHAGNCAPINLREFLVFA